MVVVLKTFSGMSFRLEEGKQVSLVGNSFLNQIDDAVWGQVKKAYPNVDQMVQDGYVIESKKADANLEKEARADAFKSQQEKQEQRQGDVKITEEK